MGINRRLKRAFGKVARDIKKMRTSFSDALFSLNNEYAKLRIRVQELESRVEELEEQKAGSEAEYSFAKSY